MPRQDSAARCAQAIDATPFSASAKDLRAPRDGARAVFATLTELAAAAHDLRDPLQVIASYSELLADGFYGPVNGEQRDHLMRVCAHVEHLSAVVDSMLMLARAKHRGTALELSDLPIPTLLADVSALIEPFAVAGGVSLVVDVDQGPATVRGDRTSLSRVLTNLAGNAVKFTPRGGCVSLSALLSRNAVELRVTDTGPGISGERLDTIFDPFVQLQPVGESNKPGMGLGLAIARDLTCLMGGELFAHSAVGVGSMFAARFPA